MPKLEERKPDVYERALAKTESLTAYVTRPSIGAALTLLRAMLVERQSLDPDGSCVERGGSVDAALAAFVGDTQIHD